MNDSKAERFALGGFIFLSIGILSACVALGLSFTSLIIAVCGAASHTLYHRINRYQFKSPGDYLPSGETLPALVVITILFSSNFNIPLLLISGILCIYISCGFIMYIRLQKRAGFLVAGTSINSVFILMLIFSADYHGAFNPGKAVLAMSGILRHIPPNSLSPAVMIIPVLVFLVLENYNPHMRLFSTGKDYFRITGYSYRTASIMLFLARGLLLFVVIACGGLLYNRMPPLTGPSGRYLSGIADLARTLLPFSVILLLSIIAGPWPAIVLSVLMSYTFLALETRGKQ